MADGEHARAPQYDRLRGRVEQMQASSIAAGIAERLPNCRFLQRHDFDHFAPMTHPAEVAELLTDLFR